MRPQVGGLYWVAVTRDNVSPSLVTELLMRLYWICRDYFGYVSEEARLVLLVAVCGLVHVVCAPGSAPCDVSAAK